MADSRDSSAAGRATSRIGLPPFPTGWYAVCFSGELSRGEVKRATYFGQELVVFRTASGEAAVVDAHCPHMGAHFGYGGTVQGETLRCPFHGFCFNAQGDCVSTPYGKRTPRMRMNTWPVVERNGAVFTWFDEAGREPQWEIPELSRDGYARLRTKIWPALKSHPQETTENSVDFGHLSIVHGYEDVAVEQPLTLDGPYLNTRYGMTRQNPFLPGMPPVRASFEVHVWGLGYSFVQVDIPRERLKSRHFVFPTPIRDGAIDLRVAVSVLVTDPAAIAKPLALLPRRAVDAIVGEMALRAYTHDVAQDFDIWENKRYLQPAALADGDGPVGPYRKWCKQFYP